MKKTLCSLLIIAILMNFIMCSVSYADGQSDGVTRQPSLVYEEVTPSDTLTDSLLHDGKTSPKNGEESEVVTDANMGGPTPIGLIMSYVALIIDVIPLQMHVILSILSFSTSTTLAANNSTKTNLNFWISIEKMVFNQIPLFYINYFDDDSEYTVGSGANKITYQSSDINEDLKLSISKMYIICRMLSLIIGLLVLIYIGIRMAIASVSSDKAKYKKMLMAWVESIVIIFVLTYIMVLIISFGERLTNIFYDMKCKIGGESFESTIVNSLIYGIFSTSGIRLAMYSLMYWVLVYTHFKFFYLYMKRMLMVGFLIMIAPLITITYSIDKAGDGKAQAFSAWMSEFAMNVLIQPLHAIIYLVFMFTAGEIAKYAPIVGLIFMMSLGKVENTVKRLFNTKDLASLGELNSFRKGK